MLLVSPPVVVVEQLQFGSDLRLSQFPPNR